MEEREKLKEAKYFFNKMKNSYIDDNFKEFKFNLSAFLSSARSILQYTYKKAKRKSMLAKYNNLVSGNPILSFFKDKRNLNIHEEPIKPTKQVNVDVIAKITVSESVTLKKYNKKGELIETIKNKTNEDNSKTNNESSSPKTSIKYIFNDWSGNEDIIELSKKYINELNLFINDANNKGLL
ncbi:MAG: hypothetical protein ACOCV1_06420 [Bacillota bacterium]